MTRLLCGVFLSGILQCLHVAGLEYGPSLEYLVSEKSTPEPRDLFLESYFPSYSVVIPLANGSSSAVVYKVHPSGEFLIHAPEGHGIMVVIQQLRLRTSVIYSEAEDATFLKCRDFIKFSAGNQTSFKTCGSVLKYSKEGSPRQLLGPRTFITNERQLTIKIETDKSLVDHDYGWHETIAVELVITGFKPCPKNSFMAQWQKWMGSAKIKSCSPSEDNICINTDNICDGVMNCGVKGPFGHIGYDEQNCKSSKGVGPSDPVIKVEGTPTTTVVPHIGVNTPYQPPQKKTMSPLYLVLIFSVVVLLLFGACTWLAKANEKKFQHTVYRFSTLRRNRRNSNVNGRGGAANSAGTTPESLETTLGRAPTAPVAVGVTSPAPDLPPEGPPPYDDLFPSASAPPLSNSPSPTATITK